MVFTMISQLLLLAQNVLAMVTTLPYALLTWIRDWLHFRKLANRFPGPPTRPLVGNLFDCGGSKPMSVLHWLTDDVLKRYPVGQVWFGTARFLFLGDVNDIEIFLKNPNNQSKPKTMLDLLSFSIGSGLVTINGDVWRQHHRIIRPSFHQNLLNKYVSVFNRRSDIMVELLSKYANGRAVDIQPIADTFVTNVVCETLLGVPSNLQSTVQRNISKIVNEYQKALLDRMKSSIFYVQRIYNSISSREVELKHHHFVIDLVKKAIEKRIEILRCGAGNLLSSKDITEHTVGLETTLTSKDDTGPNSKYSITIDALLHAKDAGIISYQDVLDELRTMYLAGFETANLVIQFAFYLLAKNPSVQEKAVMELRKVFEAAGTTEVTPEILQRLQYVEMIIKETMRMYPPAIFFVRIAGVDTPLASCDLIVPAGATVIIAPKSLHMDPKYYPAPHVFDPDRFSPENCARRHPFAHLPFAAGARACIGKKFAMMELKTILSKIIWNFRIEPDETYEPEFLWGIILGTSNGMRVKLVKREN